jgi:hypothetical protein
MFYYVQYEICAILKYVFVSRMGDLTISTRNGCEKRELCLR